MIRANPTSLSSKAVVLFIAVLSLVGMVIGSPVVSAQSTDTTSEPTTTSTPGPQQPNGDASSTYTYNPETGMWENDYYIWNPITKQTTPKYPTTYSYNPQTGMWDTTEWWFNAATGRYEAQTTATTQPPADAVIIPDQQPASSSCEVQIQPECGTDGQDPSGSTSQTASQTGPGSNNGISNSTDIDGFFNNFFNATISHTLDSRAQSGDATVSNNTSGGSATTGDATAMSSILNMISSLWNLGKDVVTFVGDLFGNVFGDVTFNPNKLGPGSNTTLENSADVDLVMNNEANATINNDINLQSQSGDANVSGNTQAGNATTGDANTILNLVNMINSAIASGNSFMGALNIYGNLEGDILFPKGMIDSLIAASGPNSTTSMTNTVDADLDVNLTDNMTINNNIVLDAGTGDALVSNNTQAGNASTGDALTNLTLLNLTGREVIGDNAFLVFVNVLGKWVGMIMDAPGATAAAVGGNLSVNNALDLDATLNSTNNSTINNNVYLGSQSGDATVDHNTLAGNATTGNATASANIANLIGSNFSIADWFGILFINVFGTWNGSFGVDTPMGNAIATFQPSAIITPANVQEKVKVYALTPTTSGNYRASEVAYSAGSDDSTATPATSGVTENNSNSSTPMTAKQFEAVARNQAQPMRLLLTTVTIALVIFAIEQLMRPGQWQKFQMAVAKGLHLL